MLEDLKDELDLPEFFEAIEAKKVKKVTDGYKMCCVKPDHNDSGPSLHYKTKDHKFYCYGCGFRGDIIDMVQASKNLTFRRALSWIKEYAGYSSNPTIERLEQQLDKRIEKDKEEQIEKIIIPIYFEKDFEKANDLVLDYIEERNWNVEILSKHDAGYCEHGYFKDRIIFPVWDNHNNLTTFVARDVTGEADRYLYPKASLLSQSIWPLHLRKKIQGMPIFVEGVPDAMRLREYGYNAFACLGNQLGDKKIELIQEAFKNESEILVIPDGDKGGQYLFKWFGKLVHSFKVSVSTIEPIEVEDGLLKDIDDIGAILGKSVVDKIVNQRKLYHDVHLGKSFTEIKSPGFVNKISDEQDEIDQLDWFGLMNYCFFRS